MAPNATDSSYGTTREATYEWTVNVAISITFTLLGCITILLRTLTLCLRGRPIGGDDIAMYAAFGANAVYSIASWISIRLGVGLREDQIPASRAIQAIKAVYVVEIGYFFCIFFIKVSILCLYLRIASPGTRFRKATIITMAVIVLQITSSVVVEAVQCIPMKKYWDQTVPGHCINITVFFYSVNVFTIVTDVVILALPVSTLWKIQRPKTQRIGLLAAFLVGGISTLASCARLYSVRVYTQSKEPVRDAAQINLWSFIEINLGILCASVPAIKPLFDRCNRRFRSSFCGHANDHATAENGDNLEDMTALQDSKASLEAVTTNPTVRSETRKLCKKPKTESLRQHDSRELCELPPLRFVPTGPLHPFTFTNISHSRDTSIQRHLDDRSIMRTTTFSVDGESVSAARSL